MVDHYPDGHNVGIGMVELSAEEREIERLNRKIAAMIVDGEEDMIGDEADYWIMFKARRARLSANVYFKGEFIWVGGRPLPKQSAETQEQKP